MKALFIVKRNNGYGASCAGYSKEVMSGLWNSARFVVSNLNHYGLHTKVVDVVDNNDIDREVTRYKPNIVFIEALWVVPEKVKILMVLHPKVKWVVRIHSNTPFLANEGNAVAWIKAYSELGVVIAPNAEHMQEDLDVILGGRGITPLLPNCYKFPPRPLKCGEWDWDGVLRIGCFGSLRPMKNQLIQAVAAIDAANRLGYPMEFHINASRHEQNGCNVLKNIRALYKDSGYTLVEHQWLPRVDFLEVLAKMNLSMQVSFSETFNIVTADSVSQLIPVIVSSEIDWVPFAKVVPTTDAKGIAQGIVDASFNQAVEGNWRSLYQYNQAAVNAWLDYLL